MSDDTGIYTIYLLNYAFIIIYKTVLATSTCIMNFKVHKEIVNINTSLITVDSLLIIKPFLNLTFKNKDS